jgi:hypothetical protein
VAGAATVCLLTAGVLGRHATDLSRLLAAQVGLSVLLWLDDAFLLHEEVLPTYLGVPELVTYGAYALAAILVALRLGSLVLRHPDGSLLLLAVGFFGLTVVLDVVSISWLPMRAFAEASAQLYGGLCWTAFALRASWRLLVNWVRPGGSPAPGQTDRRQYAPAS